MTFDDMCPSYMDAKLYLKSDPFAPKFESFMWNELQLYNKDNNVFAEKIETDILRSEDMNDKYVFFVENFGDAVQQSNMTRESIGYGMGRKSLGCGRESIGARTTRHIRNFYQTEIFSPILSQQVMSLTSDLLEK